MLHHSRSSRSVGFTLLLFFSALLILGPVGCAGGKPRDKWWQFWRPKKLNIAGSETMIPPPPGGDGTGASMDLGRPDVSGADVASGPGASINGEGDPIRSDPRGPVLDLVTVHFEYDSYALDSSATETLDRNLKWIKEHPGVEILIEGHCDERGTVEYNLNLGQHRANAVKEYLAGRGVTAEGLHTISYGEERPIDGESGESAWAKNRRAQFLVY